MSQICLFSRHIPLKNIKDGNIIIEDIEKFNHAKHKAFTLLDEESLKTKKEQDKPDLRKKENKELKKSSPPSPFMTIKELYGFNTYFVNSILQEAKATLRSIKELRRSDKKKKEKRLKEVKEKLEATEKRLAEYEKTKGTLIEYSKWQKDKKGVKPKIRMPKGSVEVYDTGKVHIFHYDAKKNQRKLITTYDNLYLFEVQYLNVKIKNFKYKAHLLKNRTAKIERQIKRLEEKPSICFGSRKLFKKQFTVYAGHHDEWKSTFRKSRYSKMTISGRKDAGSGNFVFSYNPEKHALTYKSMSGKEIMIPKVIFPYGQELLEEYFGYRKEKKLPIGWSLEKTGGSLLVKCILNLPEDNQKNYYYGNGCIASDNNADCFAITETDSNGNLIYHEILPFDLKGLSSEQTKHVLSHLLEIPFKRCVETNKPFVMEDLKDMDTTSTYGPKALNRTLSSFTYGLMKELALSKGRKYHVDVKFINPAYTSQMGKVKYMSRYGLSIHEAASLVIGRRGMGYKEKMPASYFKEVPDKKKKRHHWSHWAYWQKILKDTNPSEYYKRNLRPYEINGN